MQVKELIFLLVAAISTAEIAASEKPPVPQCSKVVSKAIGPKNGIPANGAFVQATKDSNFLIKPGECLVSPNRAFALVAQSDGEFVLYRSSNPTAGNHIWAAGTTGNENAGVILQNDGKFVIYKKDGIVASGATGGNGTPSTMLFQRPENSSGVGSYYLTIQDDGNAVIYRGTPKAHYSCIWSVYTGSPCTKGQQSAGQCKWVCNYDSAVGQQCQNICR